MIAKRNPTPSADFETKISDRLKNNRESPWQFREFLKEEIRFTSRKYIDLNRALGGSKILLDRDITLVLTHPATNCMNKNNPYFVTNILEILDRQIDLDDILFAYSCIRANVSQEDVYEALCYVAKKSRHVFVWKFLTSVLAWNVGTKSLRFLIKEQNSMYVQELHQKYLMHESGAYLSEQELLEAIRAKK